MTGAWFPPAGLGRETVKWMGVCGDVVKGAAEGLAKVCGERWSGT